MNASAAHLYESAAVLEFLSGARQNTTQNNLQGLTIHAWALLGRAFVRAWDAPLFTKLHYSSISNSNSDSDHRLQGKPIWDSGCTYAAR
jgi:hypothetical protein